MTQDRGRGFLLLAATATTVLVFVVDRQVEQGVAVSVLYVGGIWLAYAARHRAAVWTLAGVSSLLTLTDFAISLPTADFGNVLANRGLALIAIWLTALPCLRALQLLKVETRRAEVAERSAVELARQREEATKRSQDLARLMEELRGERAKLSASEMQYRRIVESALDAVVIIDQQGRIAEWNPQAEQIFGWPRDEALGRSMAELVVPPRYRHEHRQGLDQFLRTGEGPWLNRRLELSALNRDGDEFPVELAILPIKLADRYQFCGFVRDITERRDFEQRLLEADRHKDQFIAMIAHELRNPLAPIRSATQVLELIPLQDETLIEMRDVIQRQVALMARLLDDLLDVSRIARGQMMLRRQHTDLCAVVRTTAEDLRNTFAQQGVELCLQIPDRPLMGDIDPTRIAQCLGNILQNAGKFTDRGGRVCLTLAHDDRQAAVTVADTAASLPMHRTPMDNGTRQLANRG